MGVMKCAYLGRVELAIERDRLELVSHARGHGRALRIARIEAS
jgi:hypothetical protein